MCFSGPVILRRKYFDGPTLFLHFCDQLPPEDLVLYLNKLEFLLCKNELQFKKKVTVTYDL
jgi:hypothetical protein